MTAAAAMPDATLARQPAWTSKGSRSVAARQPAWPSKGSRSVAARPKTFGSSTRIAHVYHGEDPSVALTVG
jgi:hypothetical protein